MMSKVALIFGGSGEIGQAICSILEEKGMIVYSTSYQRPEESRNPYILRCDVTRVNDIEKIVSYILKRESKIDIVVNSVTPPLKLKTIENLAIAEFKRDINTILIGEINIAKAIIPIMKVQKNGIIINILSSSVLGNISTRMSSYISAKYGLFGFTKCLAVELKPFNVNVYGVSPSFVETNLIKVFPSKLIEIEINKRKNGKLIQPAEVADIVLDIVRNTKKYKTGVNIEIS